MNVSFHDNNFYVMLSSDESKSLYNENKQSSFNNQLVSSLHLDDDWTVGISEVYIPAFEIKQNENKVNLRQKRKASKSLKSLQKKQKREIKSIHIKNIDANGNYEILLPESKLRSFAYQRNDVNLGKLMMELHNFIFLKENNTNSVDVANPNELRLIREGVKDRILNFISDSDLSQIPHKPPNFGKNSIIIHCYFGSNKSINVETPAKDYESIEDFIKHILIQIPVNKRNKRRLLYNFNYFYTELTKELKLTHDNTVNEEIVDWNPLPEEKNEFKIEFKEHDAKIQLTDKTFIDLQNKSNVSGITLQDMLKVLSENTHFKNQNEMSTEEINDKHKLIAQSVYELFLGNNINDQEYVVKEKKPKTDYFNVLIPYDENKTDKFITVAVEVKTYEQLKKFMDGLIQQLPKENRNHQFLTKILQNSLTDIIQSREKEANNNDSNITSSYTDNTIVSQATNLDGALLNSLLGLYQTIKSDNGSGNKITRSSNLIKDSNNSSNISTASQMIYIFSTLIRPHMLSNNSVKILRAIPCYGENTNSIGVHHVYSSPEYYPLEKNYFNSIDINIVASKGNLIEFKNSDIPVYIMLHFKKN